MPSILSFPFSVRYLVVRQRYQWEKILKIHFHLFLRGIIQAWKYHDVRTFISRMRQSGSPVLHMR